MTFQINVWSTRIAKTAHTDFRCVPPEDSSRRLLQGGPRERLPRGEVASEEVDLKKALSDVIASEEVASEEAHSEEVPCSARC